MRYAALLAVLFFAMPVCSADDDHQKSTVVGTLNLHKIEWPALKRTRTIRVWLPPGYDTDSNSRFSVLYMQDGQNCFDQTTSAFGHEWQIDETMTALILQKKIPPMIVVGIDNGGENRIKEYTYEIDPKHGGGDGAAYAEFLLSNVKTFIDKTYRTLSDRDHMFIGGSSLGGLISLEIARRHPNTFAGVMAMSPSIWWAKEVMIAQVEKDAGGLAGSKIWIDSGTKEGGPTDKDDSQQMIDNIRRFDQALTAHCIEHHLMIDDQHVTHNEQSWAARFPDAIVYLLTK